MVEENKVSFEIAKDVWGSTIDTSRFGTSLYFDLYFSFSIQMKNDYYPKEKYTARVMVVSKSNQEDEPLVKVEVIEPVFLYGDCFLPDTKIRLETNDLRKISDIQIGDYVCCGNGNIDIVEECAKTFCDNLIVMELEDHTTIGMSEGHMFKTNSGFMEAKHLTTCDYVLRLKDGCHIPIGIQSIKNIEYNNSLYFIKLKNENTLYANDILVGDSSVQIPNDIVWSANVIQVRKMLHNICIER